MCMKLLDNPGAPNPARIRIVLAEKGIDGQMQFEKVSLIAAEHKQDGFLKKNPLGVLPVLQLDDGTYLSESTAITEYLDNLDGHPVLTGRTPKEKGVIHMMQRRAEAMVLDPIGIYFHHGTPGLGAQLQVYKSPEWAHRTEWAAREREKAEAGLSYFNGVLAATPFVAGEQFSMSDITLFVGLLFADLAGIPMPERYTALAAWRVKVSDRPSVKNRSGQSLDADDLRSLGF